MPKLFADNVGIVSVMEKPVAIPANIEVSMSTIDPYGEYTELQKGFSCFTTGFQTSRKSQYQLKQSIDHKTHIIPFGEAPEMLTITGITFGFSQINGLGVGKGGEVSGEGTTDYRVDLPDGKELVGGGEDTREDLNPTPPPKEGFIGKIGEWVTSIKNVGLGIRNAIAEKLGGGLTAAGNLINKGLSTLKAVGNLINSVRALPGQIVRGLLGGLLGVSGPQKQLTPKKSVNSQYFPLSFPELNMLFENLHAGSTSRVANKASIVVSYCGVRYTCVIDQISFQAEPKTNSISFTMNLLCLYTVEYRQAVQGTVVRTRGTTPTLMAQVGQALGSAAMDKIRGSGLSVGPVSIGRLLG